MTALELVVAHYPENPQMDAGAEVWLQPADDPHPGDESALYGHVRDCADLLARVAAELVATGRPEDAHRWAETDAERDVYWRLRVEVLGPLDDHPANGPRVGLSLTWPQPPTTAQLRAAEALMQRIVGDTYGRVLTRMRDFYPVTAEAAARTPDAAPPGPESGHGHDEELNA